MTEVEFTGVFISDRPLDVNEGAAGSWLLTIELTADAADLIDREYEWVDEGKSYREWLVPARS